MKNHGVQGAATPAGGSRKKKTMQYRASTEDRYWLRRIGSGWRKVEQRHGAGCLCERCTADRRMAMCSCRAWHIGQDVPEKA